ncbi:DUF2264 domain-containing protein [Marinilactibacillus sp. GCM10026970]|uniref:DUF2264 domain-containing protein n=1 Tax=Marinilactibacillus sp. GCM10026970 TaxID=3252642 RepID=UPI00360BBB4F
MINYKELELFKDKKDTTMSLNKLLSPLDNYFENEASGLKLSATGVAYGGKTASVESLLRLLWGIVPLETGGESHPLTKKILKGIINGTNPDHPNYWGTIQQYDQLIVEMSALGYMLLLKPEVFWQPLSSKEKLNLVQYMRQVNSVDAHDCNWLFFAVIVNLGLRNVGEAYDKEVIERNLNRVEDYYISEGWYQDGVDAHIDYYVSFGIHFYSLLYATFMEEEDPKRSKLYKERAKKFSEKFKYWFSEEGQGIPYGRSMTYRFCQVAFYSIYIYADVDPDDIGWMKGIILRNFRYWFKQPIFNGDGTLSVGYVYPNLHMSEDYNAPGSPYWALKSFLILALPEDHLFWKTEEAPFPEVQSKYKDKQTGHVFVRDHGHVVLFQNGYKFYDIHNHTAAKYEKFAYSTHFGFSIPRSNFSVFEGAYDSMLALSEDGEDYRIKRKVIDKYTENDYSYIKWKPWKDVTVETYLIPGAPWHVRIHKIITDKALKVADGGFALGKQPGELKTLNESFMTILKSPNGVVGAVDLQKRCSVHTESTNGNTNLIHPNTVIPFVRDEIEPGNHLFIHGFYGSPDESTDLEQVKSSIEFDKEKQAIRMNGEEIKLNFLD